MSTAPKTHIHVEQFDGALHAWCGRGETVVTAAKFEATDRDKRCRICERWWFPNGQPDWHFKAAKQQQQSVPTVQSG